MAQEEIQLLLKDLSARLMYGVMCQVDDGAAGLNDGKLIEIDISRELIRFDDDGYWDAYIDDVKPYLRPMSSMTEEECDIVEEILGDKCIFDFMSNGDIVLKQGQFSQNKLAKLYDYYTSIHVDYRGLIPMGLALEAPEGMYKIN